MAHTVVATYVQQQQLFNGIFHGLNVDMPGNLNINLILSTAHTVLYKVSTVNIKSSEARREASSEEDLLRIPCWFMFCIWCPCR